LVHKSQYFVLHPLEYNYNMNYIKLYDSIIKKAQFRAKPESYTEKHHIVPKSLGGADDDSNLVHLTAREHCLAHLLLAKIHGGKMWHAANMMTLRFKLTSKAYAIAQKNHAKAASAQHKGKPRSEKTKQKISLGQVGKKGNSFKSPIMATNIKTGEKFKLFGRVSMEAAGFNHGAVYQCAQGKRITHKGYTFARVEL